MKNFTASINQTHVCRYPGVVEPNDGHGSIFSQMFGLHPIDNVGTPIKSSFVLKGSTANFRFISCNVVAFSGIRFMDLFNVFDTNIWITLAFTVASWTVSITALYNPSSLDMSAITVVKILLEQGDPFCSGIQRQMRMKFIIFVSLFGGNLISNAYKNANIYRLSLPRQRQFHETLDQLIENNYTAYSRYSFVEYKSEESTTNSSGVLNWESIVEDLFLYTSILLDDKGGLLSVLAYAELEIIFQQKIIRNEIQKLQKIIAASDEVASRSSWKLSN